MTKAALLLSVLAATLLGVAACGDGRPEPGLPGGKTAAVSYAPADMNDRPVQQAVAR